jgi:hypothetical protein
MFRSPSQKTGERDDGKRRGNKYAKMAWLNEREHDGDRNKNQTRDRAKTLKTMFSWRRTLT